MLYYTWDNWMQFFTGWLLLVDGGWVGIELGPKMWVAHVHIPTQIHLYNREGIQASIHPGPAVFSIRSSPCPSEVRLLIVPFLGPTYTLPLQQCSPVATTHMSVNAISCCASFTASHSPVVHSFNQNAHHNISCIMIVRSGGHCCW